MPQAAPPRVSVVTVNSGRAAMTCELLESLRACTYAALEVVLVDDGAAADESARFNYHYPGVVYARTGERLGFAGATNLGIARATGTLILLLGSGVVVDPGFLEPLVEVLSRKPEVGMASPKIVFGEPAGVIEYAGAFVGPPGRGRGTLIGNLEPDDGQYDDTRYTELPHGACVLVRRAVFEEVGLLPEFYFMYFETLDFAVAARRAGFQTMYCGASRVTHRRSVRLGAASPRKTYCLHRDRVVFSRRTMSWLAYLAFVLYYLSVAVPAAGVRFLRKRNYDHLGALGRALGDSARQAFSRRAPLALPHLRPPVDGDARAVGHD